MASTILSQLHPIHLGTLELTGFDELLSAYEGRKKLILCDENTHAACLEYLLTRFTSLSEAEVLVIPAGEENKIMDVCLQLWEAMTEYRISRHDLLINLGGGVVTDMGGLLAGLYKRGIAFVNVPTSLLAMVDASVGGKCGVDFAGFKNQLGLFATPKAVFIDPHFLQTLPHIEVQSAYAEMAKHGLIASQSHWREVVKSFDQLPSLALIEASIRIKAEIVDADFYEGNLRKRLNFGHTSGHAIESFLLENGEPLPHGHCVAFGMFIEAFLSVHRTGFSKEAFESIKVFVCEAYERPLFDITDVVHMIELMRQDKKNDKGGIEAVLLKGIGEAIEGILISEEEWLQAFSACGFLKSND